MPPTTTTSATVDTNAPYTSPIMTTTTTPVAVTSTTTTTTVAPPPLQPTATAENPLASGTEVAPTTVYGKPEKHTAKPGVSAELNQKSMRTCIHLALSHEDQFNIYVEFSSDNG